MHMFDEKTEINVVQILNNILNENHHDFMPKLLPLKSQTAQFLSIMHLFLSFLKFSLSVNFKIFSIGLKDG